MTDRPIIFSAPMVLALLAGRKTQTRRLAWRYREVVAPDDSEGFLRIATPWQRVRPGDRLWVREAWAQACELDEDDKPATELMTYYRADGEPFSRYLDPSTDEWRDGIKWSPSIHMPRSASRITLTVTDVRVQRLQEISEDDAGAEGARVAYGEPFDPASAPTDRRRFELLWNHLHGPDAWKANPHVVALTFTVAQRNIDAT